MQGRFVSSGFGCGSIDDTTFMEAVTDTVADTTDGLAGGSTRPRPADMDPQDSRESSQAERPSQRRRRDSPGAAAAAAEAEAEELIDFCLGSVSPMSDWYGWCRSTGLYIEREELIALQDDPTQAVVVVDTRDDDVVGGMIAGAIHCPDGSFAGSTVLKVINAATAAARAAADAARALTDKGVAQPSCTAHQTVDRAGLDVNTDPLGGNPASQSQPQCSSDGSSKAHPGTPQKSTAEAVFGARTAPADRTQTGQPSADIPPTTVVFHCMESARRGPRCARRVVVALEALDELEYARPQLAIRVLAGGFDQWARRFWNDPTRVVGYSEDYWCFGEFAEADAAAAAAEQREEEESVDAGHPAHPLYTRPADQPATPWSEAGSGGV